MLRLCCALSVIVSLSAVACNSDSTPAPTEAVLNGQPFVAVERDSGTSRAEARQTLGEFGVAQSELLSEDGPENFYVAIHRSQLTKRWFLSAYMRNMYPGGVLGGAARSLASRVVTFREQNGKVFLVDADDRKHHSTLFDPDILIDAFPIITDFEPFNQLPGADDYVLIDPSNGLNEFTAVGDLFGSGFGARVDVELSFMQNFRLLADGVGYEQVFAAYTQDRDDEALQDRENPYRLAGTLGIALRAYSETEGYTPTLAPAVSHYFTAPPIAVPDTGASIVHAAKWAIGPDMPAIEWLISREVLELQSRPEFAEYDLVGAIKGGIESWNTAFGFEAITARVAEEGEDMAQDDKNVLIVDPDPRAGFAFANWRVNPNTGEIRGASVYLSGTFLASAHANQEDDPEPVEDTDTDTDGDDTDTDGDDTDTDGGDTDGGDVTDTDTERVIAALDRLAVERPKAPAIQWGPLANRPLCDMYAGDALRAVLADAVASEETLLTKKEKVERILAEVVAHEIGHTLGLRHNFKGSLVPPTTSVMEYQVTANSIAHPGPGEYDIAAIQYLYGLSDQLPTQPFCTDQQTIVDPTCARFDEGPDPLIDSHLRLYNLVWGLLRDIGLDNPVWHDLVSNPVLGFVRASATAEERRRAWDIAMELPRAPVAEDVLEANPLYGPFADKMSRFLLKRLLLDAPELRGPFVMDPPAHDAELMADILDQVSQVLENTDGIRSYTSRRAMVDILKKRQSLQALQILLDAKAQIAIEAAQLELAVNAGEATSAELLLVNDLLAHIERASQPYFN